MKRLMIAGGGTGGHLFPGVAVAQEFIRRDPETRVMFVGTGRPLEERILAPLGFERRTIRSLGFKGKGILGGLKSLLLIPSGVLQARELIKEFKPDLVLGVGGYVSGPVGLAARLTGVPSMIHEQNSVPGMANRILGRIVDRVCISFEKAAEYFPKDKTGLTGNPIRKDFESPRMPRDVKHPITILVLGGSQGAGAVNRAVVGAANVLKDQGLDFEIIHQTGPLDIELVRRDYERMGVRAVVEEFIRDMNQVYRKADLAVCRAGALTISEIAVMGLPAVFIPLPTAANNHQEFNARWLVEAGAAEIVLQSDDAAERVAEIIGRLIREPENLSEMSKRAAEKAVTDAAAHIWEIARDLVEKGQNGALA